MRRLIYFLPVAQTAAVRLANVALGLKSTALLKMSPLRGSSVSKLCADLGFGFRSSFGVRHSAFDIYRPECLTCYLPSDDNVE